MKQRNPKATCETCAYLAKRDYPPTVYEIDIECFPKGKIGICGRYPEILRKNYTDSCGEHPDFFVDIGEESRASEYSDQNIYEKHKRERPGCICTTCVTNRTNTSEPPAQLVCAFCDNVILDKDNAWRLYDGRRFCGETCARTWGEQYGETRTI